MDLIRWFFKGSEPIIEPSLQPVSVIEPEPVEAPISTVKPEVSTFDYLVENSPKSFLEDLQSLRPVTRQFDLAREELVKELRRLAPPKKRRTEIFKNAA